MGSRTPPSLRQRYCVPHLRAFSMRFYLRCRYPILSSTPSVPKLGYAYPQGYAKWFRGWKTDGIRGMYPLKQNCNFHMETSFCASKSRGGGGGVVGVVHV